MDNAAKIQKLSKLHENKLLILDFWATWCGSCIKELPTLDSLQLKYKNELQIVGVGYESYKIIAKFFTVHPENKPINFPIVTNDIALTRKLFPHKALPHLVWINPSGKVIAITGGENVTAENIHEALNTGTLNVGVKKDNLHFDFTAAFHLRDSSFMGRSIFTKWTPGILSYEAHGNESSKLPDDRDRILMTNMPLIRMYWLAAYYHRIYISNFGRIILETKDSLKFMQPRFVPQSYARSKYFKSSDKSEWARENTYCYELRIPKAIPDSEFFKGMVIDLNRYLNLNGRFEKRLNDCYILKSALDLNNKLKGSDKQPQIKFTADIPNILEAQKITQLVETLNENIDNGQIINETGLNEKEVYDFDLKNLKLGVNLQSINQMLEKYGLFLERGRRIVPMFVISEK